MDLEAVERALRAAVLGAGAAVLSDLLTGVGVRGQGRTFFCPCGCSILRCVQTLGEHARLVNLGELQHRVRRRKQIRVSG